MHDRADRLASGDRRLRAWTALIVRRRLSALGREADRHLGYDTRDMGFFRKLFGGGDVVEPEAPEAAVPAVPAPAPEAGGDPYRGPAFVATDLDVEEVVHVGDADPIFTYRGRVLAVNPNRRGPLPLRSMVYTGFDDDRHVLRRVTFGEKGYRIDWEHRTPFDRDPRDYVVRVEDRILFPLRKGMMAIHLETGKPCWELPHPSAMAKAPQMDRDGNLLLVFEDQSWMVVSPRDGATVREGVARNERDVEKLSDGCTAIANERRYGAHYSGVNVECAGTKLRVNGRGKEVEGHPTAPTAGEYPIDGEWEPGDWVALASGKLLVELRRRWGDKRWAAVAVLDPTSLEPLQLLELGEVRGSLTCWIVDDLIVIDTDVNDTPDDVFFIIDPVPERVVAMLREEKADAFMFDRDGARIWAKPL
jgi:hypothetical protein